MKPVAIATKELQENQLVLGDLFKIWLGVELELDDIGTETGDNNLITELRNAMKRRKSALFSNNIFWLLYIWTLVSTTLIQKI